MNVTVLCILEIGIERKILGNCSVFGYGSDFLYHRQQLIFITHLFIGEIDSACFPCF